MRIDLRKVLAGLLALTVAAPAWGLPPHSASKQSKSATVEEPEVVGVIVATQGASVREALAPAGTTVYSGDTLRTSSGALVSLGLSSAMFAPESRARFSRWQGRPRIELERGRMSLRSSAGAPVEARLADAIINGIGTESTILSVAVLSEKRAIVSAERGSVIVRTPRDGKSVRLRTGESAEVAMATVAPQESSGGANAPTMSRGRTAVLIGVIIGGVSLAAWALRPDGDLARSSKQDLISPYQLP